MGMGFIPVTDGQRIEMLRACGVASIGELFADIPKSLAPQEPHSGFFEDTGISELEVLTKCEKLSSENNTRLVSFLGGGFYDHFIPAAVDALASRGEFYTAYTPYQPELSQGTLQAIYEYQSQVCRLTGLQVSNASLYDGGTAIFEACRMAMSQTSRGKVVIDCGVNPTYRKMLKTHTAALGVDIVEVSTLLDGSCDRPHILGGGDLEDIIDDSVAAVVLQNPNFLGIVDDHTDIVDKCKSVGAIAIQSVYPIALPIIKSPAEQGFDIAVGEGQSLGLPLSFGGPYLGFIGAKKELARKMPGRIVARTTDAAGREGFVLSLQAREQHIRREKATSNICSNEALCALRAHIYLSLLGKDGLIDVAELCYNKAMYLRGRIRESIPSIKITDHTIFNEFTIELPISADDCVAMMMERGFAAGIPIGCYYGGRDNVLLVAVTEKRSRAEMDAYVGALSDVV